MPIQGYIQAPFSSSLRAVPITQASWLDTANVETHATGIDSASIDFGLPRGTDVLSMAPGIVIGVYSSADENNFDPDAAANAGNDMGPRGFGNVVTVFHYIDRVDSELPYYFVATYAHLEANSVASIAADFANLEEGEQLFVEAGTNLGEVGTSGYSYGSRGHLHVNFGVVATSDNLLASGYPLDSDSPYPNANENLLNFLGFDAGHSIDGEGTISPIPLAELQGNIPVFSYITSNNTDTGESPAVENGSGYGGSGGVDGPDLVGADLGIDGSNFDVGETFDFVLDISNMGDLNSGGFSVSFYITEEQNLNNAVYSFSEDDLFSLSPGETNRYDYFAYTDGTWYSGDYYLAAVIDSNDDVGESDETNNVIFEQFYLNGIEPGSRPDLTAENLTLSSTTWALGASISATWDILNIGTADAEATQSTVYLSSDANVTTSDLAIITDGGTGTMNPGEVNSEGGGSNGSDPYIVPDGLAPGTYYAAVIVDDTNTVAESNESNNKSAVVQITVGAPDLIAQNLVLGATTWNVGDAISANWDILNIGTVDADATQSTVYLSTDANVTTSDIAIITDGGTGTMNPGEVSPEGGGSNGSDPYVVPDSLAPGTYYVAAIADVTDQVGESDEFNNVSNVQTVTVLAQEPPRLPNLAAIFGENYFISPDYPISTDNIWSADETLLTGLTVVETGLPAGASVTSTVTVFLQEADSIGATDPNEIGPDAIFMGETDDIVFEAGSLIHAISQSFTMPSSIEPGTYRIVFSIDHNNELEETSETDNILSIGTFTILEAVSPEPDDLETGGAGRDVFYADERAVQYDGGAGRDQISYMESTAGLLIDMTDPTSNTGIAAGDTFENIEWIHGSDFNDTLIVNIERAFGRDGDDIMQDTAGAQRFFGGEGNDTFALIAGDGAQDRISDFTLNEDVIDLSLWGVTGLSDLNIYESTSGQGELQGRLILEYFGESLRIDGLSTADIASLDASHFLFADGEPVDDDGDESVVGTAGDDLIDGLFVDPNGAQISDSGQVIDGLAGNDIIYDGAGDDTVSGGAGRDIFYAGDGADRYDGGTDRDAVDYTTAISGLTIDTTDAANSSGIAAGDTYQNIEWIYGSDFADTMVVNISRAYGQDGDDIMEDTAGYQRFFGGDGSDTFRFVAGDGTQDRISDFTLNEDVIDLSLWGASGLDDLTIYEATSGQGVLRGRLNIDYNGESIRIDGLTTADINGLDADHFVFL